MSNEDYALEQMHAMLAQTETTARELIRQYGEVCALHGCAISLLSSAMALLDQTEGDQRYVSERQRLRREFIRLKERQA